MRDERPAVVIERFSKQFKVEKNSTSNLYSLFSFFRNWILWPWPKIKIFIAVFLFRSILSLPAWLSEELVWIMAMQLRWRELKSKTVQFWYKKVIMYEIYLIMTGQLHFVHWIWQVTKPTRKVRKFSCSYFTNR